MLFIYLHILQELQASAHVTGPQALKGRRSAEDQRRGRIHNKQQVTLRSRFHYISVFDVDTDRDGDGDGIERCIYMRMGTQPPLSLSCPYPLTA